MHRISRLVTVLALMACVVAPVTAEPPCDCPIKAAMQKLPTLVYSVVGETTGCDKHAADLAEAKEAEIQYVVQQLYGSQAEAQQALIDATEGLLVNFTTPSKCSVSGTTTIAGEKLECEHSAAKLASAIDEAVKAVHVSYKVGDEECHCPNQAKALAQQTGEKTLFVVAGEETCCPLASKLNLARAKYRAALQVVNTDAASAGKAKCSKCKGCPIEAAMKDLPALAYVVGGEATGCDKHAAKLAKEGDAAIQYAVHMTFDCKQSATLALVTATEALVDQFATPATCEKSGSTTVAGKKLECSKSAARLAKEVRKAMETVQVSYVVDGEKCNCPNKAAALAEAKGAEKLFVVDGESTACEITSRLNLARAKYRAAVEALAKLDRGEAADES